MKTSICTLIAAAAMANVASAGISYQSQERYVTVGASLFTGPQGASASASGFADFDRDLSRVFSDAEGSVRAVATQFSSLGEYSIVASGMTDGSIGAPAGSSGGWGNSYFEVSFDLAEAMDYTLDLDADAVAASTYSFVGGSMNIAGGMSLTTSIHESGTLDAGSYTFIIDLYSDGFTGEGSYSFGFQVVPAPAGASLFGLGLLAATRRRR